MKPYCLWWVDQPLSNAQLAWQVEQMVRQGIERIAVGGVEEEAVLSRLEDALTGVGIEIVEMEEAVTFFEPWAHVQTLEAAKFAYIGASAANVPQQPIALLRAFLDRDMPLQPGLFYQSPQWPFFQGCWRCLPLCVPQFMRSPGLRGVYTFWSRRIGISRPMAGTVCVWHGVRGMLLRSSLCWRKQWLDCVCWCSRWMR